LFDKALAFRNEQTHAIDDRQSFDRFFTPKSADKPEIHGGLALSHWCGRAACESAIKDALKVTVRCIPLHGIDGAKAAERLKEPGACIVCREPSQERVVFAKSY
jgi:prolyl-tRNA synthetase